MVSLHQNPGEVRTDILAESTITEHDDITSKGPQERTENTHLPNISTPISPQSFTMESTQPSQAPRRHKRKSARPRPDSGFASTSSSTPPSPSRSTTTTTITTSSSSHHRISQSSSSSPSRQHCYPSSTSPSRPQRRRERQSSSTSTTTASYRSQPHRPETADPYLHHRIALQLFGGPQTAYPAASVPIAVVADDPTPAQDQQHEDTNLEKKIERTEVVAEEVLDWTAVPAVRDESGRKGFWRRRRRWGRKRKDGACGYEEEDGGSVRRYRLSDQENEEDDGTMSKGRWRSFLGLRKGGLA
ncbi:MAG: hypothetical protein Q9167_004460 [Letrouitia subvulpina]